MGEPMLIANFVNEPSDTVYIYRKPRELFEQMLLHGQDVHEASLIRAGFEKVDGRWVFRGK